MTRHLERAAELGIVPEIREGPATFGEPEFFDVPSPDGDERFEMDAVVYGDGEWVPLRPVIPSIAPLIPLKVVEAHAEIWQRPAPDADTPQVIPRPDPTG